MTALQQWLNSSSAGTARVDNFTNRVTLTADFLATYNVIILASLSEDSNMGPFWTSRLLAPQPKRLGYAPVFTAVYNVRSSR